MVVQESARKYGVGDRRAGSWLVVIVECIVSTTCAYDCIFECSRKVALGCC